MLFHFLALPEHFFPLQGGGGWLELTAGTMEHDGLKNVNNCLNNNIYSYLETTSGQSSNLYLTVIFPTPVLIRHLWQLKTVVSLHWCLIHVVLLLAVGS